MAKARSIVTLSGTLGEVTFVDSKAYGFHSRKKRSSWEKSEGMERSSNNQTIANAMAKVVFDSVNQLAPGFKDGTFWSRLVSAFRQQQKRGENYSYAAVNGLELRPDYPSSQQGRFALTARPPVTDAQVQVCLDYDSKANDAYRLSVWRIATDQDLLVAFPVEEVVVELNKGDKRGSLTLSFSGLPTASQVLYALKFEQLIDGETTDLMKGKSVKLLTAF